MFSNSWSSKTDLLCISRQKLKMLLFWYAGCVVNLIQEKWRKFKKFRFTFRFLNFLKGFFVRRLWYIDNISLMWNF
jgi:hypothetical protein